MLPPKTKFVREMERGRHPPDAPPPSPPVATYLHRVLRRWRHGGEDADSILPVHEKRRRPLRHAIYTRRPGARPAASRGYGSLLDGQTRWDGDAAAVLRRRRRRLTFFALMLAATVLVFGAAALGFVLISAQRA
ncbi:hypothetical protein LX32DRAFT_691476 [Colletotrichum zoysiae]|uniref:Uncharacterized protein n=1 Tax=Colletotrichum zoysiae TaxID=1216348 RepID=A0AAD9M3D2_9PEZI|nr:hypothetical protein LX32DRAFT_691476 [Colletotrichum zoysiae]